MAKIVQLFVVLALCVAVQCQCNGLTVYENEGNKQINTNEVCNIKYVTKDCIEFYKSFNQSRLPEGYPINEEDVQPPSYLSLSGLESPFTDGYIYPGLLIKWKSPGSANARKYLYGFLVVWFNQKEQKCQLFNMTQGDKRELQYEYQVQYVTASSDYTVRVYSMPPAPPEEKDNPIKFVSQKIRTMTNYSAGIPGYWQPFVTYEPLDNGTINFSFSLAPANFNLTKFSVYVREKGLESKPVFNQTYFTETKTAENTQYYASATVTKSGLYNIVIWVEDMFHKVESKCQCWIIQDNSKACSNICGSTLTGYFYVNITNPPTTTSPKPIFTSQETRSTVSTVSTSQETGSAVPTKEPSPQELILGIVFGVAAFVVLILLLFCIFNYREKVKDVIYGCISHSPDALDGKPFPKTDRDEFLPATKELSKRTVYIMSADDHEAHVELVRSFVQFLEVHCFCSVILPSDKKSGGGFAWVICKINTSDYLIFINSEGAQKLTEAHVHGRATFQNREVGPEGDLFIFGLEQILNSEEVRDKKLVFVSFHGIQCKKYLSLSETYEIPKHLPHFLQKIHGLDAMTAKKYNNVLPMDVKNIPKLIEGSKLMSAITNVTIYEKNNPNWFEMNFGELLHPNLTFERLPSNDSDYGSLVHHALDSVSQIFSEAGSPTSDRYPSYNAPPQRLDDINVEGNKLHDVTVRQCETNPYSNNADVSSCFTVAEEHERIFDKPVQKQPEIESLIPPVSMITCSSYGSALNQINRNNEESVPQMQSLTHSIIPPERASEIVCDSFSSACSEINRNNEESVPQMLSRRHSIIPPETASEIACDSFSSACSEINRNNEESISQMLSPIHSVIPPETASEIACDSFSTAFSEINRSIEESVSPKCFNKQPVVDSILPSESSSRIYSITTPESTTENVCDSCVINMMETNRNNESSSKGMKADRAIFQGLIIPPDNPLEINIDSVSSALADINANSDDIFWKGFPNKFIVPENEDQGLEADFDSVSV